MYMFVYLTWTDGGTEGQTDQTDRNVDRPTCRHTHMREIEL